MFYDDDCELCRAGFPGFSPEFLELIFARAGGDAKARHHGAIRAHLEAFTGARLLDLLPTTPVGPTPLGVLVAPPAAGRRHHLLMTSGMSDLPMRPPEGYGGDLCWAELSMCLPGHWRFDREALRQDRWNWPLGMLAEMASYPHVEDAWVWDFHTLDFQDPYEGGGSFEGVLFGYECGLPEEFRTIRVGGAKEIRVLPIQPLYRRELGLALESGPEALRRRLAEAGVGAVVDPGRSCAVG